MQAASAASLQLDSRYRFRISFKKDTGCRTVPVAHQLSAVTNFMLKKQFFASKMEELQKQRAVLTEQLSQLITQKSLETRVEEESRLEYLIKQVKDKREHIEQEMLQLEAKSMADGKDVVDCGQRIQQALMQLIAYLTIDPAVGEVFPMLNKELNRMKGEGIASDDEIILEKIRELSEQGISSSDFVIFFKELNSAEKKSGNQPDYKKLSELLQDGSVVLCIGQEISSLLGSDNLSTAEIKNNLAMSKEFHGPLSELCEERQFGNKRLNLVRDIRKLLNIKPNEEGFKISLCNLLARRNNDKPLLIISAAYDDLLEQSLLHERRNIVVIYPVNEIKTNKTIFMLRYCEKKDIFWTAEDLSDNSKKLLGCTVIYRLRGGILDEDQENLLISERDYFRFSNMQDKFPDYLTVKLRNYALCFLGHHPDSWEERLLVKTLQELRSEKKAPTFAVQKDMSKFAREFWKDSDINCFDLSLTEFIQKLKAAS